MQRKSSLITIAIDGRFLQVKQRGMPVYLFELLKRLPLLQKNWKFCILINSAFEHNSEAEEYLPRLNHLKQFKNVEFVDLHSEDQLFWEQKELTKWLKENKPDLLHMPGNRVCFFSPVQQVATFHDAMEWTHFDKIFKMPKGIGIKDKLYFLCQFYYVKLQYILGLRKCSFVMTISKYALSALVKNFPFISNKIDFAYHGIPDDFLAQSPNVSFGSRKGVLMLGGDSYQKNAETAIAAWSLLPRDVRKDHPLTIVGFIGNPASNIFKSLQKYETYEEVTLKDWVSTSELVECFENSAAFLFVSREEGFGFPLIQAMSKGLPSVISSADVLVELSGGAAIQSNTEDARDISNKLLKVLTNESVWQDCYKKGLERASAFNWEYSAKRTLEVYKKVLKSEA